MKRVVIVDDHTIFLNMISSYIRANSDYEVVTTFNSGNKFLKSCIGQDKKFDCVILDLSMDDGNGYIVLEELKKSNPHIKIIIMTFNKVPRVLDNLLKNGADGIINKSAVENEIVEGLKKVGENERFLCSITSSIINRTRNLVNELNEVQALTKREREVLTLICEDELTNAQIASKLFISEKTVKTHRNNIYTKLQVNSTIQLVRVAMDLGYVV